jgi:hypothetical protein
VDCGSVSAIRLSFQVPAGKSGVLKLAITWKLLGFYASLFGMTEGKMCFIIKFSTMHNHGFATEEVTSVQLPYLLLLPAVSELQGRHLDSTI